MFVTPHDASELPYALSWIEFQFTNELLTLYKFVRKDTNHHQPTLNPAQTRA